MKDDSKLATLGRRPEWTGGIVNPPVARASTCLFDSYQAFREAVKNPDAQLFYGRRGTQTHYALREALTELEGGHDTWLFPSGLAAIVTSILAFAGQGDRVLMPDSVYEPTRAAGHGLFARMGIETRFYDPADPAGLTDLLDDQVAVVVVESPGSLTFEMQDVAAIAKAAHKVGARVIMDNTWATPLFFRALDHGVNVVMHACTKYIVGHSDAMLGSATATKACWPQLNRAATQLGQICSADDAWLGLRGLRTLGVRLRQHEQNALTVAKWLKGHGLVERVLHPALPDDPGHALWRRDFSGSSGLFSFVLKGGQDSDIPALTDNLHHFRIGFSWGGYESLILPSDPSRVRTATSWQAQGPLIRLHIGLEDPDDLIEDLAKGLALYERSINA